MTQLHILVVDDDRDFAESMAMVIEGRGHKVDVAFNGRDAVRKFRATDYDIAFMDVKLPGMNGVESFMEVRKFKPYARVVMMTGYSVQHLLSQAVAQGAWGVLHKPLDMTEILQMIEKVKPDGVLIADDDPDFVKSVEDVLKRADWKVSVAANGREALDCMESTPIDVLILDLRMPILNGLETYMELKRSGHAVPTIIVTAYAEEERQSIDSLLAMSVTAMLRKPFDPRDLIRAVEHLAQDDKE